MKQKVVIKVSLNDKKTCTKVIRTAVGVDGVIQAALQKDKNQIEVTGDGIDVVVLVNRLRKSLKYAEVVSVTPVEEKKEAKKEEKKEEHKLVWPYMGGVPVYNVDYVPVYNVDYVVRDTNYIHYQDPPCSIM